MRVIARQVSGKNRLAAIFASRHQDASPGPLGVLILNLVDVSDIFYFFSVRGGGRGSPRRREGRGGGSFFYIENPGGGGSPGGEGPRGWEGVCSEFGNLGGGGVNIFFRGRNVHQVKHATKNISRANLYENEMV